MNTNGQLGINSLINSNAPSPIATDQILVNVFATKFYSLSLYNDLFTCNGKTQYGVDICNNRGNCIDNKCKIFFNKQGICDFGW
jgi:hypothetical protein